MTPLTLGRISGFRGVSGEVTLKVASGRAERWIHLRRAIVASTPLSIEAARAYRDRLVLKFAGIDDANQADALSGSEVRVMPEDLPSLPDGEFFTSRLLGARVRERSGADLGTVDDVIATGGTDLLVVSGPSGREILVPLAAEIVVAIDEDARCIEVVLPEGLRELNAENGDPS